MPSFALRSRHTRLLCASILAVTNACSDTRAPLLGPSAGAATTVVAPPVVRADREPETDARQLSRELPSFGGYFIDSDGAIVIAMRSADGRERAQRAVLNILAARGGIPMGRRKEPRPFRFVDAKFSFEELAVVRDALEAPLDSVPGVVFLDLDEAQNRVVVGARNNDVGALVQSIARRMALPIGSVVTLLQEPISLASASAATGASAHSASSPPPQTLNDRFRPFQGGTRVFVNDSPQPNVCTLTVAAYYDRLGGQPSLIVPSHCTDKMWYWDHGTIAQPFDPLNSLNWYFGEEIFDHDGRACGSLNMAQCRHAEVTVFSIAGAQTDWNETLFQVGLIARPTYGSYGPSGPGTNIIDYSYQSSFRITGTRLWPVQGEYLEKVGIATGWTYGDVYRTCVDSYIDRVPEYNNFYPKIYCADYARLGVEPGDSGSPVFSLNGDGGTGGVTFIGMVWAKDNNTVGGSILSNYNQMQKDAGAFRVF